MASRSRVTAAALRPWDSAVRPPMLAPMNDAPPEPKPCHHDGCVLPAQAGRDDCVLHEPRRGKTRTELLAAFRLLDEANVIRIRDLDLRDADLSGIFLGLKNLQHSDLSGANFDNARMTKVGFDFSTLDGAHFENAILEKVDLRRVVSMRRCHWYEAIFDGVQVPAMERVGLATPYDSGAKGANPKRASYVFRHFKELYKSAGDHDTSGLFYEREMDMRRIHGPISERIWWWMLSLTCGYGERPMRTVWLFFVIIFGFATLYLGCDVKAPEGQVRDFPTSLYFSIITFTSLGYGDILPVSTTARLLAGCEAVLGVFSISLFVFVFCRRMVR